MVERNLKEIKRRFIRAVANGDINTARQLKEELLPEPITGMRILEKSGTGYIDQDGKKYSKVEIHKKPVGRNITGMYIF